MNDYGMNDEKQAKADLKRLLDKNKTGDAPVSTTLRQMGQQFRMAETAGKKEAIKGIMRLIRKHRFLAHLDNATLESVLKDAAGLTK